MTNLTNRGIANAMAFLPIRPVRPFPWLPVFYLALDVFVGMARFAFRWGPTAIMASYTSGHDRRVSDRNSCSVCCRDMAFITTPGLNSEITMSDLYALGNSGFFQNILMAGKAPVIRDARSYGICVFTGRGHIDHPEFR